jgi:DNA helicase-2/ATP-dependent DNA helicase PcrA
MISYLKILFNINDVVSWNRALLLCRGIGPKSAARVVNAAVFEKHFFNIDERLMQKEDVKNLFELFKNADTDKHSPVVLLEGFLKYYQPLLKEKYDDFNKRLNDLDSLLRIASRYDSLEKFLADMALQPPERSIIEAGFRDRDDSSLVLSTIHSAKGLEWHTVFVIYVAEGHLPSYLSLENNDAIEEERRLFYVATTRARENLFLLKPHIDRSPRSYLDGSGTVFTQVSRFMDEPEIMNKLISIEGEADIDFEDVDFSDVKNKKRPEDKEFLEMLQDYFRDDL